MKWERDKKLHLLAGALIAAAVALPLILWTKIPLPLCCFSGFAVAAVVGWGKEYLYDKRRPQKHTVDKDDFIATALGGALAAIALAAVGVNLPG